MDKGLLSDCLSVLEATRQDDLQAQLVRFTHQLGFDTFTATVVVDCPTGESRFTSIDNPPAGFRDLYDDSARNRRDPVMQHLKRSSLPIVWSQATYLHAGLIDKWEEQARFGYRGGICLAMHMPNGHHFAFGFDRAQPLPPDSAELASMVASIQLLAVYAREACVRLLLPSLLPLECSPLTARELEVLRWTLEGKTAWEVGCILGIAENTVIRHAHSATQKLGCTSKHHAAVKALRFGLI